jgi:fructose-bisphosphate aldolase class II
MPLINAKDILKKAYKGKYAIGAFNVNNMETVQGIAAASYETKSYVIFQISPGARRYAGCNFLSGLVKAAVEKYELTAVLHLDHGNSFEICKECIDSGFTSVMIDGSKLSFEENIDLTKRVVDYAGIFGVSVEAELGQIDECGENKNLTYTCPFQACEFIEKTGIDSLAVSMGTCHGINKFKYVNEPVLRFDIPEKIAELRPEFPLVLHGASSINAEMISEISRYGFSLKNTKGVPEEILRKAAETSVCKVNVDSDLRLAMTLSIKKFMYENPNNFDPRSYFGVGRKAVEELVKYKIENVLKSKYSAI